MRGALVVLRAGLLSLLAGCTSFATVRSAEVRSGPSASLQASARTPPGDEAAWFWSLDCAERCNRPVPGADAGATVGWRPGAGRRAVALGVGLNGLYPYVDGYVQLGDGGRPFGLGARVGLPLTSWREHQLYGRYDVTLGPSRRLLLNPALFLHEGRSPNGENAGSFLAFVQGIGVEHRGEAMSLTPALAIGVGRARRDGDVGRRERAMSMFAAASLGVTVHRRDSSRP